MALYPLCGHGREPSWALSHAARAISDRVEDKVTRADILTTLAIFGRLRNPGMNVIEIIGREAMNESSFYQEILDEGRQEAHRADVLEALEYRFGAAEAATCTAPLESIRDAEQLSELLRRAIGCRTIGGFRRTLAQFAKKKV